jgi:glycosyltransferase involved in cell wall biosynthesis
VWSGFALLMARERLGYATLFEANSLPSVELPFHYPGLRGLPALDKIRGLERTVLAESDAILCVSRVTRSFLVSLGAPARRIEVVPNGVDPAAFAATPLPALDGRVPTLLYVGTLADWQGLATAVEALPRLLERRPVRLRLVGRGRSRQRKELLRRVRRLGLEAHVSLEPGVPHAEIPALIAAADVCLAPLAYNERNVVQGCCPLKVLESVACGRPLVASNLPVVRELVREEREALLVPPDAPDALAAAVLRILEQPRLARRLAQHGATRMRTHFTWKRAQERLLRLYDRLLAGRGTTRDRPQAPPVG